MSLCTRHRNSFRKPQKQPLTKAILAPMKAADIERAEGEVFYSPMVAEPQEYKYNADAFEARKTSEEKQEAAGKELPKVREEKAR